jgi:hypothetical protein
VSGPSRADNRGMTQFPPETTVTAVPPGSAEGCAVLAAYFRDIVARYHGGQPRLMRSLRR